MAALSAVGGSVAVAVGGGVSVMVMLGVNVMVGVKVMVGVGVMVGRRVSVAVGAPPAPIRLSGASQVFEHGVMIYVGDPQRVIYAIFDDGHFRRVPDTWVEGVDPTSGGETPPNGLIEPIRGFGKVWRDNPDVRAGLGWARAAERGEDLTILPFANGQIVSPPGVGRVFALADDPGGQTGQWRGTAAAS